MTNYSRFFAGVLLNRRAASGHVVDIVLQAKARDFGRRRCNGAKFGEKCWRDTGPACGLKTGTHHIPDVAATANAVDHQ